MTTRLKCNSCGATYPDTTAPGSAAYFHACPDQLMVTPAKCDANGNLVTPAVFAAMPNPRNENLQRSPDKPGEYMMISEGAGVTPVA